MMTMVMVVWVAPLGMELEVVWEVVLKLVVRLILPVTVVVMVTVVLALPMVEISYAQGGSEGAGDGTDWQAALLVIKKPPLPTSPLQNVMLIELLIILNLSVHIESMC